MNESKKYILRQKWHDIHVKALKVHTQKQYDEYCQWIWDLIKNFPCQVCGQHLLKYTNINSPEECVHPFIWTWKLHNDVNYRLGKETITYNQAIKLWASYL